MSYAITIMVCTVRGGATPGYLGKLAGISETCFIIPTPSALTHSRSNKMDMHSDSSHF